MSNLKQNKRPLGASGTDVVGKIHGADEHIEILTGSQAAQFYDRMRRSDTQVKKVLSAICNPIKSAEWAIEPASTETKDIEAAALIDQILFKDILWPKFLNEALTKVIHGYSLFEVVHENKQNKEIGMYTGLAQLGYRKQTTITEWCHNVDTGRLEKVKQEAFGDIRVNTFIDAENLLIFYSDQEGDNIGFPLGRILYGPYKRKLLATELQYIGIERFAIPTPLLEVPAKIKQSDDEYIKAQDILKNFTSAEDSFIMYPSGWKLDLHNNVFDPSKIQIVIQAENENMSGAILASFLELGIGGNGGAFALSNDLSDFFLAGLEHYANGVNGPINVQLIPNLMALNFGEDNRANPKLKYSGISDKAGKELMEIVTGYSSAGVIAADEPLEDHVRKVHHLPPKAEGEMLTNQESEDNNGSTKDDEKGPGSVGNNNSDDDISGSVNNDDVSLKLAEKVGHRHKFEGSFTGPAIQRGGKHFHQLLDSTGEVSGRTKTEVAGVGHLHFVEGDKKTGKPIETVLANEPKDNPKTLIVLNEPKVANIIRDNLDSISNKYIADIMNRYKQLPPKRKLNATKGINVGGIGKFRKELKSIFTVIANESLKQAKIEVPSKSNVKLSDKFEHDGNFKFNEFSKLPKRIQLLIANQANLISDKEAKSIADTVAFQFNSSESSTEDIAVIRADLNSKAEEVIQSGTKDTVATTAVSTVTNEARNSFLLDPEVQEDIASYTFINFDPKSEICKTLAGVTFGIEDTDLVRHQPPLHQNCKSYIRANLKTNSNNPDITGLPPISEAADKSITLKESSCHC